MASHSGIVKITKLTSGHLRIQKPQGCRLGVFLWVKDYFRISIITFAILETIEAILFQSAFLGFLG